MLCTSLEKIGLEIKGGNWQGILTPPPHLPVHRAFTGWFKMNFYFRLNKLSKMPPKTSLGGIDKKWGKKKPQKLPPEPRWEKKIVKVGGRRLFGFPWDKVKLKCRYRKRSKS